MIDGGVLLSTIAEASVAVVAIVGGLLASRIVSLATEQSGLRQRRDELQVQLDKAKARYRDLESRLLRRDAEEILESHLNELARTPENVDLAAMIAEAESERAAVELQPMLEEYLERLRSARRALEPLFRRRVPTRLLSRPSELLSEVKEMGLITVPPGESPMYEAVCEALCAERKPHDVDPSDQLRQLISNADLQRGFRLPSQAEQAEHAQLRRDRDEARHVLDSFSAQLDQVMLALARVSRRRGAAPGIGVLIYFAVVGTVLPLVLLVTTDSLATWAAWIVVGLFATGLAALVVYLTVTLRRIGSS